MTDRLTIRRPDDWHVHLRDGAMLTAVARHTARQFARAIVMPNLTPPVTTIAAAQDYRARIMAAVVADSGFTPLMTCYLTDTINPAEIARGHAMGVFTACKLYPAHATTNSAHGVTDIRALTGVLETMQRIGMPLLIHGEVTDASIDIFDREAVFVERKLAPLTRDYPALKIVLEHITTAEAAAFVAQAAHPIAATITPQHLLLNRNALFDGGLRPARLLPARGEARGASAGGAARGDLGQRPLLPGHRQRAACRRREAIGVRVRGHLQRAVRAGGVSARVRRGRCARPVRRLRVAQRRALLRVAGERGNGDVSARPRRGTGGDR